MSPPPTGFAPSPERGRARRPVAALALVLAVGCAGGTHGFDPAFARETLGCDWERVTARAESLGGGEGIAPPFTPRRGWNACVLLSHNGPPDRVERLEARDPPLMNWRYEGAPGEGMVTLRREGCPGGCGPNESPWKVAWIRW